MTDGASYASGTGVRSVVKIYGVCGAYGGAGMTVVMVVVKFHSVRGVGGGSVGVSCEECLFKFLSSLCSRLNTSPRAAPRPSPRKAFL